MDNRSTVEVGALVKARRLELRITEKQLQESTKIDPKTLKKLENGERWPQEETRMKVEVVLGWAAGSIAALREGRAATVLPDAEQTPKADPGPPLQVASDEELLTEFWRRLEEARSGAGVHPVATDERKHPVPGPFFRRTNDAGEAGGEDRRQESR